MITAIVYLIYLLFKIFTMVKEVTKTVQEKTVDGAKYVSSSAAIAAMLVVLFHNPSWTVNDAIIVTAGLTATINIIGIPVVALFRRWRLV